MKKVLFIFLIFCFNLNIISCSSSSDEDDIEEILTPDTTAATLAEVTFVTTPTNNSTPNYTFSSDEAGIITYGGSCSSGTTSATSGNNTITLVSLSEGTYSNCTIIVTDSAGNVSNTLTITSFTVNNIPTTDNTTTTTDTTAPTVTSVSTTADNQSSVSITDNITVTFSEAMDTTTVTTNTSNSTCSGTMRVSSDNFSNCVQMSSAPASSSDNMTFTLNPSDNLTRLTTYLTRVTTGVKDTAGNAMSSQYETETSSGFTTDNISTAKLTVSKDTVTNDSNSSFTSGTTYYWKVVASDPKGGSAQSETWSFIVQ